MLSCSHNLCMNCVGTYLRQKNPIISNKKQYIICELCGSKTEIDVEISRKIISSIVKNLNINQNKLNHNEYNNNIATNNLIQNGNKDYLTNQLNIINSNSYNNILLGNSNKITYNNLCKVHGEPLSYICFDCISKCICSECIINGIHNKHDVLSIKKAYPLIYEKAQELQKYTNEKLNELNFLKNNLDQKKINIGDINQRSINEIRNVFQLIYIKINNKEKEIIEKTEAILKENFNELNTYINIIQSKILTLNKIIENLNTNILKKDELNLINYYYDNKNDILLQIGMNEITSMSKINSISDLKINFDKNSFNNLLKAMNDLEFEINNFKKVDLNINKINNKKLSPKNKVYGIKYKNRISSDNPLNLNLTSYDDNKIFKKKYNNYYSYKNNDEGPKKKNKSQTKFFKKRTISAKRKK